MDELTRLRAYFALQQLERIMGPAEPEPLLLVALDGGRRTSAPRARLRSITGGRRC